MKITPKDVKRLAGISYRQLQYWESSGLIDLERDGRKRSISLQDLFLYICIARIREAKVSIQQIRRHYLEWLREVISTLRDGESIYLIPQPRGLHGLLCAYGQIEMSLGHHMILSFDEGDEFIYEEHPGVEVEEEEVETPEEVESPEPGAVIVGHESDADDVV